MTKSSQELLKEIEDLRINHLQRVKKDRKELNEEITSERREKIHEEGRKETENFEKQIKEKMLSDLSSWCLDPQGFFYRVGEGLKGLDFHHNGRNSVKTLNFYNRDYWKEIKDGFINEIKQNSQDWKIEKEIDSKYDGYDWDDSWVIKHKSGRKHYRGNSMFIQSVGFSDEEWTGIENAINNREQIISQKTPEAPVNRGNGGNDGGQNSQLEQSSKNNQGGWTKYGGSALFGSLSLLSLLYFLV